METAGSSLRPPVRHCLQRHASGMLVQVLPPPTRMRMPRGLKALLRVKAKEVFNTNQAPVCPARRRARVDLLVDRRWPSATPRSKCWCRHHGKQVSPLDLAGEVERVRGTEANSCI